MKGLQPLHAHPLDHQPEVKTAESIVAETKVRTCTQCEQETNVSNHMFGACLLVDAHLLSMLDLSVNAQIWEHP